MAPRKFLLIFFFLCVSACMMPEIVTTYQAHNDFVLKGSWKDFLGKNPAPKVVLRVPDLPKDITQSEMMYYSSLYSYIEKRLLEANFTVRDRSLLKEVLNRAGGELNYADIGKKIDTDFIVEIVNVKLGTWMQGIVSSDNRSAANYAARASQIAQPLGPHRPKGGTSKTEVFGAILEGRVIMVSTGDVVGMFTIKEIHPRPQDWFGTDDRGQSVKISSENLSDSDIEYLRTNITGKLIDFLRGLSVPDSIVTSSGASGQRAWSGVNRIR